MAEKQQVASNKAGIELAKKQATPRDEAPVDVSEGAVMPETLNELNAILAEQELTEKPLVFTPLEPLIPIINEQTDLNNLEATAAGAGLGGGGGGGSSFVTLLRIVESVNGNQYGFDFSGLDNPPVIEGIVDNSTNVSMEEYVVSNTPKPEDPLPPVIDPKPDNSKPHEDNGKGNGVDDAPGNSGDTKGDNADGSNTPGTKDTLDPKDVLPEPDDTIPLPEEDKTKHANNGFGNGDQTAPGNSLTHNGAENDLTINLHQQSVADLLKNNGNPHVD